MKLYLDLIALAGINLSYLVSAFHPTARDSTPGPSESDWNTLNTTLSGRLISLRPPAAVCHAESFNKEACSTVKSQWTNSSWRATHIGAMQNIIWEQRNGEWCTIGDLSDSSSPINSPCEQGNIPRYGVSATSAYDIQKAVSFASRHNLPIIVKGTGHDLLGRSSRPKGLLIWTHQMRSITFNSSHTICGKEYNTITVEAGVQWGQAFKAMDSKGRIVPGGGDADVGASGGQVQGGGHSIVWSNTFGLTADSVVSFQVVTTDGKLRTVDECSNSDLFWALRGGGGGTYAIAVSTTYQTYPAPNLAVMIFNFTVTREAQADVLDILGKHGPKLAEEGWAGYFALADIFMSSIFHLPLTSPDKTVESANATFQPILSLISSHEGVSSFVSEISESQPPTEEAGTSTGQAPVLGSRLIPKSLLNNVTASRQVAEILANATNIDIAGQKFIGGMLACLVAGGKPSKIPSIPNSVHPAWRDAVWHMMVIHVFEEGSPKSLIDALFEAVTRSIEPLRELTPGGGAYMNEADARAPNWKEDFFGENYGRLLSVKKKYDQNMLLRCNLCVGSDLYDP
jgi:hypothetical protein